MLYYYIILKICISFIIQVLEFYIKMWDSKISMNFYKFLVFILKIYIKKYIKL